MDFSGDTIEKTIVKNFGSVFLGLRIKSNKLVSDTVEELYAEYVDGEAINAIGYDAICKENFKHEIKYTDSIQGKNLRVNNLTSKKDKCDFIVLIDGISNSTSIIPQKVFFKRANITTSGSTGEFSWDSEYIGKRQKNNTKLFLDYKLPKNFKVN